MVVDWLPAPAPQTRGVGWAQPRIASPWDASCVLQDAQLGPRAILVYRCGVVDQGLPNLDGTGLGRVIGLVHASSRTVSWLQWIPVIVYCCDITASRQLGAFLHCKVLH